MNFSIENNILKGVVMPIDDDHKLGQLIYDTLSEIPDHVTQIDAETSERTTGAEMKDRSVRCAVWMKKFGISTQDIVVVVTHNHLDSYIPVFATFFIEAIFNPWNPNITLYTAQRFMKKFRPKLIFTCEATVDVLKKAAKLEKFEVKFVIFGIHSGMQSLNDILNSQTNEEVSNFEVVNEKKSEDVAAIMMSSGTSGFPKGVMLKSKTLLAVRRRRTDSQSIIHNVLWYSTLNTTSCMTFMLRTLLHRHTRIIPDSNFDVESFFQNVEKYKVNIAAIPSYLVIRVTKFDFSRKYDLQSLKSFIIGGSKQTEQTLITIKQILSTAFISYGYGSTETAGISYVTPEIKNIESTGFPVANCQIKFVNLTNGKALGPKQNGEVCVKTPDIMVGYYEDPEATSRAFDENGWYRTGDIGYYNEDGEIFIVDRMKEIVKYRSRQISPAEIEEVLLSHPDVHAAAVVAIPHELDGYWPVAFVQIATGSQVTANELMELTSVLEDFKKLRGGIHLMDNLPRTGSGKIAKNELKQLAETLIHNKSSQC